MRILYYTWNENPANDCISCMKDLGHDVTVFSHAIKDYSEDPVFAQLVHDKLFSSPSGEGPSYDCIFSFNYFPVISSICEAEGLPYISWVYDSPHLTLESVTLSNKCNHIYLFDYALCEKYNSQGFTNVHHMPLAYYSKRIDSLTNSLSVGNTFTHDISFIGNLYNDQYNFYDQINELPDFIKGYIDGIINAQLEICGGDIIETLFDPNLCREFAKYVNINMGNKFRECQNSIILDMIRKKATSIERPQLLSSLGNTFNVALYSGVRPDSLPVEYMGIAENSIQMPTVFATSKINLNISLRTIKTGIPLRVIDILGAGGFCLSNYQPEFDEYFSNGRDLVWYYDPMDMMEKAAYYLDPQNELERKTIARSGHEIAREIFSYEKLLPEVLKL